MKILVTGAAGFIGFYVAREFCRQGYDVTGLDNLNDYYDPRLKQARLEQLKELGNFTFIKADIADREVMADLFRSQKFSRVIHLAAQAGVRYSLENPMAYADSNLTGMMTVLEGCRQSGVEHLVFASSSSVYGMNSKMPYSVADAVDHPVSLYAATKRSNELMAHSYAQLYQLPVTGLRFFTVCGPWGRPDMALWKFTRAILEGEAIDVFNQGELWRDFTDIDDILKGIMSIQNVIPESMANFRNDSPDKSSAPYRVYNIGNNQPAKLTDFISAIEQSCGVKATKRYQPMQAGDVFKTFADVSGLEEQVGFRPDTPLQETVDKFVHWYKFWSSEH
ncbi:capsular biosynthesis protein CpsI [Endozoicomonas sp. OPT23]|uniref:NAD-dependent epimerase n=1 Tax=Endozoicomonas sp. OPT23 TaxID=2072845 RepID=UPI001DFBF89B|nr:capsular biosynthesis protein CpsI [Endozoicomonas sp. OPT23]